jgi:small subunit ribosomal protein S21
VTRQYPQAPRAIRLPGDSSIATGGPKAGFNNRSSRWNSADPNGLSLDQRGDIDLVRNAQCKESKLQVLVRDNNVDQALRFLKKKLQREGVFREMRLREHYEKPSVKRAREKAEGIRRVRKMARKKLERESGIAAPKKPKPPVRAKKTDETIAR